MNLKFSYQNYSFLLLLQEKKEYLKKFMSDFETRDIAALRTSFSRRYWSAELAERYTREIFLEFS